MSDRPTNKTDSIPEEPKIKGGWRKPSDARGAWHPPQTKAPESEGWRVPAIPADLQSEPETEGTWHVPRPEDTIFSAEDKIEVKPDRGETPPAAEPASRPEDMLLQLESSGDSASAESTPTQ